ncbi:hypothetical protein, partial [Bacteroides stercoris]|uniref:hypothetical protein n=1 Tax=Bacteroides stercoris TaxID=46506 RepID=UPI001C70981E
LLFFSLFCLLSWGQQIFSGDYSYTCEVFFLSLLLGYYIVSHHTHITSYIWQASPLMPFCSYV